MASGPFRFLHAADFRLEQPLCGVPETPDHLRTLFVEAPYDAASRVFDAAVGHGVDFVVLAGNLLDVVQAGPRGAIFLIEQFRRLAERKIQVYWAGGETDSPQRWPTALRLPENVHIFDCDRVEEIVHERYGKPLVRLLGASRAAGRRIDAARYACQKSDLFTIAVAPAAVQAEPLKSLPVDYWALGGRGTQATLLSPRPVAHDPGSPQGRTPHEAGPHGCTLVQVDGAERAHTTPLAAAVVVWHSAQVQLRHETTQVQLHAELRAQMQTLVERAAGTTLLVSWSIAGDGPLLSPLRHGTLATELLEGLRAEFGYHAPIAWSVGVHVEPGRAWPEGLLEQETLLGDFLRAMEQHRAEPQRELNLARYLSESTPPHARSKALQCLGDNEGLKFDSHDSSSPGSCHTEHADWTALARLDPPRRERVLHAAARLGYDLLSGEGISR
jgi:hypothetical protein